MVFITTLMPLFADNTEEFSIKSDNWYMMSLELDDITMLFEGINVFKICEYMLNNGQQVEMQDTNEICWVMNPNENQSICILSKLPTMSIYDAAIYYSDLLSETYAGDLISTTRSDSHNMFGYIINFEGTVFFDVIFKHNPELGKY
jgi:hypothetical protein